MELTPTCRFLILFKPALLHQCLSDNRETLLIWLSFFMVAASPLFLVLVRRRLKINVTAVKAITPTNLLRLAANVRLLNNKCRK